MEMGSNFKISWCDRPPTAAKCRKQKQIGLSFSFLNSGAAIRSNQTVSAAPFRQTNLRTDGEKAGARKTQHLSIVRSAFFCVCVFLSRARVCRCSFFVIFFKPTTTQEIFKKIHKNFGVYI